VRTCLIVSSFCLVAALVAADPQSTQTKLPQGIARQLEHWGCSVNAALRGEFAKRGQTDWAVLVDKDRMKTILVFWDGSELNHAELGNTFDGDGVNLAMRKIRSVRPKYIIRNYHAEPGAALPRIEHDGIEDLFPSPVVHYYNQGRWLELVKRD